ncbi:MAG: cytidine deaminase [Bacteroidales bacterium]|nr:cytidine deaminase [Bacteroidales bacterium]MBQ7489008.1 cytidine deaminase [Bacteroidales bacterium]
MKTEKLITDITVYENRSELPADVAMLMDKAFEAARGAYAPYSRFYVGAAILLANGEIVTGSNQENSAYPSGLCAERTTAFSASARFPGVAFKKLVIVAINPDKPLDRPVPPCGACRQVLMEYEQIAKSPIEVTFAGESGPIYQVKSVRDLMPFAFSADFIPSKE